jgi:hypothetical protein
VIFAVSPRLGGLCDRDSVLTDGALRILDLSSKTFEEFVEFFFARELVPDDEQYDYFLREPSGQQYDGAELSSREVVVRYMTKLFSEFGRIAPEYSLAQLDQGVWGILGENLRLYELLWDSSVPLHQRVQCIRSMYFVFSDFVSASNENVSKTGFSMWWDLILHGFWSRQAVEQRAEGGGSSRLDTESRLLLDVMFETLKRTLGLPDWSSQECALHGFGHLHHPNVGRTVQDFIDGHKSELPEQRLRWVEECRDGTVL